MAVIFQRPAPALSFTTFPLPPYSRRSGLNRLSGVITVLKCALFSYEEKHKLSVVSCLWERKEASHIKCEETVSQKKKTLLKTCTVFSYKNKKCTHVCPDRWSEDQTMGWFSAFWWLLLDWWWIFCVLSECLSFSLSWLLDSSPVQSVRLPRNEVYIWSSAHMLHEKLGSVTWTCCSSGVAKSLLFLNQRANWIVMNRYNFLDILL